MGIERNIELPRLAGLWLALAVVPATFTAVLAINAHRFDWALPVTQMPAAWLALGMSGAGLAFLAVVPLVGTSCGGRIATRRLILAFIIMVGAGLRLSLLVGEPALEDDHNRYLWEGALVANGISPYAVSPDHARQAPHDSPLGRLARDAGPVLDRVNHPHLTSTYPPVAQAAFALAYAISPWSLTAWRAISLASDCLVGLLLLALLRQAGRCELWVALYWWSPIAIKELINSAHMDGVLMALVLGALFLLTRGRFLTAVVVLGLATGAKVWPVLLAPLFLRPLWGHPGRLLAAMLILTLMVVLWCAPTYIGGAGGDSGYGAYARQWTTNSLLSPTLERASRHVLVVFGGTGENAWALARGAVAVLLACVSISQAWRPLQDAGDPSRRAGLITAALIVLSPAQFPWYMTWILPFLAFRPHWGLLAATATVPLYYLSFHYMARGAHSIFANYVLWIMWLPVWLLLLADFARAQGCMQKDGGRQPR